MTSIGSPLNAPSAPSAALTTPACEHDETILTPRPRTRAARNRSSRIKGSGTACPSRTVWCPPNPASYDVTRSISPLTKKKSASTCASAWFVTRPPALSIASSFGSGSNSTSVPAGVMAPRWSGRSGCRDRKSTRLNSSHVESSYAVFCLKKKKEKTHVYGQKQKKTAKEYLKKEKKEI